MLHIIHIRCRSYTWHIFHETLPGVPVFEKYKSWICCHISCDKSETGRQCSSMIALVFITYTYKHSIMIKKQYYRSMRLCLQCWIWLITIKMFYYWYILLYTCTCFIMFLYVTSFFVKYTCQQCYVEIKKNIYRNCASFPTYTFQFSINISMGLY